MADLTDVTKPREFADTLTVNGCANYQNIIALLHLQGTGSVHIRTQNNYINNTLKL